MLDQSSGTASTSPNPTPPSASGAPAWSRLLHRTRLGKKFSEGARRLWLLLAERQWSPMDLANAITAASEPKKANRSALVSRWLYGERRPGLEYALLIQRLFGIDPALWRESPAEPFTPPGRVDPMDQLTTI